MEKNIYRSYILVRNKIGLTPIQIYNELVLAYSDSAPSFPTVCRWISRFNEGSEDIEDKDRPGRPITAVTSTNIKLVSNLIEDDIHITYEQIEAELSLHPASIHEIIHVHLKLRKIAARWVPYELTDAQKEKRVAFCKENLAKFNTGKWRICDIITGDESWIYYRAIGHKQSNKAWVARGEAPPTVQKRNQFELKSMISVFFKSTGVVFVGCLDSGKTIDAKYYRDKCLKPAFDAVKEERINSGMKNM